MSSYYTERFFYKLAKTKKKLMATQTIIIHQGTIMTYGDYLDIDRE